MLRRPLEQITRQMQELQRASASIGRVGDLLTLQPATTDGPRPLSAGPLEVEVDRLSFGYVEGDPVLEEISLHVAPGRVLGLLGRTGSGKTTIGRLMVRFYDPTAGRIRLGGTDIRDVPLAELRSRVGLVTQDVQLFHASVRDNLTFFDPGISDARIRDVLGELGLADWAQALPQGLDTPIGPHALSAGEAQLLAFARVFFKDPGLVILDEASSRLDPATEQLLERSVSALLRGRTAIVIAHRLGTVQRADEILILEGGKVAEAGPRTALAAEPTSRFASLLRTGLEEVLA
jgi:ABC-type multidrug transport system fused ATPase/permease subunit